MEVPGLAAGISHQILEPEPSDEAGLQAASPTPSGAETAALLSPAQTRVVSTIRVRVKRELAGGLLHSSS